MQITKYLRLPPELTPFERDYLSRLNKIALVFFWLHIPVLVAVAWAAGTKPLLAVALSALLLTGPTLAYRMLSSPRAVSVVYGITAMLMGGLLVHFGQGPVQIEMHFYFFALLAMLCMFANPMVNIAAAVTVAAHHLTLWLLLPGSVFNYAAQWWVVLVHAAFVVLETVAACYISRQFFDNVIGLERIVQERTRTIKEKQRDMRLILDNVEEGLVTVDLGGTLSSECSSAVIQWFGTPPTGETIMAWLGARDASFAEWLDLGLSAVRDGMLPPAITLAQLPGRLRDGDRIYQFRYQMVAADVASGQIAPADKLLVIIRDVTEQLRREQSERHQAELLQLFQRISRDKSGFIEFLTEADDLMRALTERSYEGLDHLKRLVHTLKGNAGLFGMGRLAEICHEIEAGISAERVAPDDAALAKLEKAWSEVRSDLDTLLGERRPSSVELDDADYAAILKAVVDQRDPRIVRRMIESWVLEPASRRLARIEQQIKGIADRMGKSNVKVKIEPNDLRFNSDRFAPFWSAFIHVLRNAVDHGTEDAERRAQLGKPPQSVVKVSTALEKDLFVVSVEDDGPGVDWNRLRAKASELGFSERELASPENLISLSGVSSRSEVTEMSGRGVGMGAVREACERLGGTIQVRSELGKGTRICFAFPKDQSVYEGHAAILERVG